MATLITDEQRIQLRKEPRFEDMVRASVANYAQFIQANDGTTPPAGMTRVDWAKQRFYIAEPIVNHPNNQDVQSWIAMYAMFMKGMTIWNGGVQETIDFMITSNTFETLATLSFKQRAANITF